MKEAKTIQYTKSPISCSASGIKPRSDTVTITPAAKGTEYFSRIFDRFLLNKNTTPPKRAITLPKRASKNKFIVSFIEKIVTLF